MDQNGSINSFRWVQSARWPLAAVEDDFVCLRYTTPYSSFDCAIRTKFNTAPGCLKCDQGRFNLKRHKPSLRGLRFPLRLPLD